MKNCLSSYEQACLEVMTDKNVKIVDMLSFEFKKKKKDGLYAYINEPTSMFFSAPEMTQELKDKIIHNALKISPHYASLIKKKFDKHVEDIRMNMHFDIVLMKVSQNEIVEKKFIEVAGEQHFGEGFDDKSVIESIISDTFKHELWGCHIFDATKDTKYDFLSLFNTLVETF